MVDYHGALQILKINANQSLFSDVWAFGGLSYAINGAEYIRSTTSVISTIWHDED